MSDEKKPNTDLVIHHPSDHQSILRVTKDGKVSAGRLEPCREGEPIDAEIVQLRPLGDSEQLSECRSVFDPADHGIPTRSGPAQVATKAYCDGWERTFGSSDEDPLLN